MLMADIRTGEALPNPLRIALEPAFGDNAGQVIDVRDVVNRRVFHAIEPSCNGHGSEKAGTNSSYC
jgi:hypothetical protein